MVKALSPPVTTPVLLISLLPDYLQSHLPNNRIVIGEGTESLEYDTTHPFKLMGYTAMAQKYGIKFIDLNHEQLSRKTNPACKSGQAEN